MCVQNCFGSHGYLLAVSQLKEFCTKPLGSHENLRTSSDLHTFLFKVGSLVTSSYLTDLFLAFVTSLWNKCIYIYIYLFIYWWAGKAASVVLNIPLCTETQPMQKPQHCKAPLWCPDSLSNRIE